ncbi:MAG: hypothetical protein A4S09_16380 [Proteobacteria bacterium SG_bin7]|nr:MAG: hypothetical protein A4S09_16380 [Proteobacteria bacterium SG_bin7]
MADINILSRLVNGVQRNVDLQQNALVVGSLKVGASSPTELTKTILDNLVSLQNGSDISASLHHHDGRYFTEAEISSTGATSGADRVGVNNTPANYTAAGQTVQDHLEGIDAALTSAGNEKADDVFRVVDNLDGTKKLAFQVAAVATGTTRTVSIPDANVNLADVNQAVLQDGSRAMSANLSLGNFKITNLANGTNPNDAVNLSQLDAALAGLDFQKDINALVADASTTSPGTGLPAAATGQRYILESGTGSLHAGWGSISGVGNNDIVEYNGTAWVVAYDVSVLGEGALVWNRDQNYFMRWDGSTWNEFGGLAGITAGAGLLKSGNVLSIELDTDAGIEFDVPGDAGKLRAKVDNSTIERHSSGLRVKALGITASELAADSVTTAKILDANVTTDKLANDAVTTQKLAATSVTAAKLGSDVAGAGLSGGNGSALAVAFSPLMQKTMVAGESFAANTSFLVRMARTGETAGRVYKADNNASANDNFYVVGIALSTSAVSAGDNLNVILLGSHTLGSSDTNFSSTDVGKPVYLTTAGAFSVTPPSAADTAVVRVGMIEAVNRILTMPMQLNGVN